jgi:hypothetical protein
MAAPSKNPLFEVTVGGKFGFIDSSGKLVINPQFDSVTLSWPGKDVFEEGLMAACIGPCGREQNSPC